jgi:hypothetical protein
MRKAILFLVLASCTACVTPGEVELGYLNHPAMDLSYNFTPQLSGVLTPLGSSSGQSSGVCLVCAH